MKPITVKFALIMAGLLSLGLLSGCAGNKYNLDESDPERAAGVYAELGLGYLRQGKLDMALEKLQRGLDLEKDHVGVNHYIAEVYNQMGEHDKADYYYRQAVRLDKKNPMILNNYGAYLCSQKRFDDAEEYFLRAANTPRYKTPELAYENLGMCALTSKDEALAERYFRKALELKPDLPKSLYHMAVMSYDQKKYMRARAFLQRFHGAVGYTPHSLSIGIKIEKALGANELVSQYKETLIKRFPDYEEEHVMTGKE